MFAAPQHCASLSSLLAISRMSLSGESFRFVIACDPAIPRSRYAVMRGDLARRGASERAGRSSSSACSLRSRPECN
jgi:hypothetical protein